MRPFLLLTAVAVGCSFVTAANATGTQTAAAADAAVKPIAVAPQTVPEVTKVGKASEPEAAAATPAPPASPAPGHSAMRSCTTGACRGALRKSR